MDFTTNPYRDSIPLYYKVKTILRGNILSGEYRTGDSLPSQEILARKFKVSRITIRKALDDLAHEGLVSLRRGKRTTVLDFHKLYAPTRLTGSIENSFTIARMTKAKVIGFHFIAAPKRVADALGLDNEDFVLRVEKIRFLDGETFSHGIDYVRSGLGKKVTAGEMQKSLLIEILEKKHGISITSGQQTITAVSAEPDLASLLKVPVGAPLLKAERTLYDDRLDPVEYIVAHYRGDRYSYLVNLQRSVSRAQGIESWELKA